MPSNFISKFVKAANPSPSPARPPSQPRGSVEIVASPTPAPMPKVVITPNVGAPPARAETPGSIHRSDSPEPADLDKRRSTAFSGAPVALPRKSDDFDLPNSTSVTENAPHANGASDAKSTPDSTSGSDLTRESSTRSMPSQGRDDTRAAQQDQLSRRASIASGSQMAPIVESPTAERTFMMPSPSEAGDMGTPVSTPPTSATLHPRTPDADAMSIRSTATSSGGKKKPWRRASLKQRKPSGLASAIAASGLAMVNPALAMPPKPNGSPSAQSQPLPRSPPRAERTPQSYAPGAPRARQASVGQTSTYSLGDGGSGEFFSDGSSNSEDELDLNEDDIPVTGFAVANMKRNADFHELFPAVPEGDYLIEDYGCALQREILIQGRFYISENHICFHANIFGWITDLIIPIYEIIALDKKVTAFVIPNAIQVTTRNAKYTFASFLSRDTTFDVVHNIWRLVRPADTDSLASGGASARGSLDDAARSFGRQLETSIPLNGTTVDVAPEAKVKTSVRKATQCACEREKKHFSDIAMDIILPGTPEKIYNLMFASGFIKDFMGENQKLTDIQISDWYREDDSKLLSRNFSYIKPLSGSLGPKQAKCELHDQTLHCDFDDYVVTLTTTRTPEVPSGGVFSVKTRTCIMWASAVSSRVVVTSQVEWTGRSFIKSIIEKSALDGQKSYHGDLERAMRLYIAEHRVEFIPAGLDVSAVEEPEAARLETPLPLTPGPPTVVVISAGDAGKRREHERNQRGLQWAWDTAMGAWKVGKQSTMGALDLISDAWDQSSTTTILYFVITVLVISNLWTLLMVGRREEVGRRKEMRKVEEREKWVQGIVAALWEERASGRGPLYDGSLSPPPLIQVPSDWRDEAAEITKSLDIVEERIRRLRNALQDLD